MKLAIKRIIVLCLEILFARNNHGFYTQEKQLSTFKHGYDAGKEDEQLGWSRTKAKQYNELLMAVQNKYDHETRFETALRHIKRGEEPTCNISAKPGT